jgi:hypothetical protein
MKDMFPNSFCPQSFYGLYNLDVDLRSRDSLSAGGPGASSAFLRLWGLPWTRIPAGVSPLPFQSTLFKKIQFVTLFLKKWLGMSQPNNEMLFGGGLTFHFRFSLSADCLGDQSTLF